MRKPMLLLVTAVMIASAGLLTFVWAQNNAVPPRPMEYVLSMADKDPNEIAPPLLNGKPLPAARIEAPSAGAQTKPSASNAFYYKKSSSKDESAPQPHSGADSLQPNEARRNDWWGGSSASGVSATTVPGQAQMIYRPRTSSRTVMETVMEPVSQEELAEAEAFRKNLEALRSAKTEVEKGQAKIEMSQRLQRLFTRDVERREKEVAEAEARVKKLREQLDKRKAAKEGIVNLRLQMMVNEADGLGFALPFEDAAIAPVYGQQPDSSDPAPAPLWDPKSVRPGTFEPRPATESPEPYNSPSRRKPTLDHPGASSKELPTPSVSEATSTPAVIPPTEAATTATVVPPKVLNQPEQEEFKPVGDGPAADKTSPTLEENVSAITHNLLHEKESRSIFAAQQLRRLGTAAASAIPTLEKYVDMKQDANGFPSEKQREEFRKTLASIKAAVANEKQNLPSY